MTATEEVHDLLVVPSNKKLYRFRAHGSGFEQTAEVDFYVDEYRSIMSVAQPGTPDLPRGPAFAVLPNKPDPSTSQICCYLVNAANIRAANPWTAPEWNSEPDGKDKSMRLEPVAADDQPFSLLVATAKGRVFLVTEAGVPQELDLALESEIFCTLRNGLVAGSVYCRAAKGVLPIVNVTSLFPKGAT